MMKANSPIARKLTAVAKLIRGLSPPSQYPRKTATILRETNIPRNARVRTILSIKVPRAISIPTEMKNIAMKMFFMGSMSCRISLLLLLEAIIIPMRNAPIATDNPT